MLPLDLRARARWRRFEQIGKEWSKLDFLVHSLPRTRCRGAWSMYRAMASSPP